LEDGEFRRLAAFRSLLREFQAFSEQAAQRHGLTSLQYQSLLAIKACEGEGRVTVTALAQALLVKHNSAVGLVDRIEQLGLVARRPQESDRRSVVVELTAKGRRIVARLATQHRAELRRIAPQLGRHATEFAKRSEAVDASGAGP
jgi:DNA-binding MarR family transcriptional regulator